MQQYTMSQAIPVIEALIDANIPVMLWGETGIGKSSVVHQIAKRRAWGMKDFRATTRDPSDLQGLGIPDLEAGVTRWLVPNDLPQVKRDGERGLMFLDEINRAPQLMQNALFSLILDRFVGEYKLPDGWVPIAAGNFMTSGGVQKMSDALDNRLAHLHIIPDVESFCKYAMQVDMEPMVPAFIRFAERHKESMLHRLPPKGSNEHSFPTPRGWEQVSKLVKLPESIRMNAVSSMVGEGPAGEFEAFVRMFARVLGWIPNILSDPDHAPVPKQDEPSLLFAVACALSRKATRDTFGACIQYMSRVAKEYEILMVVDAVHRDPTLVKTKAFGSWAVRNQSVVITP